MSSADTDEIGQGLLDLRVISTMSSDTLDDVLGEVSFGAVTLVVAIVLAAGLADPGVQTLRNDIRAWCGCDWHRRFCGRRNRNAGRRWSCWYLNT